MPLWTNRASGIATRNASSLHTLGGSTPSAGGGWGFTPTAGRTLVAIISGPVSHTSVGASATPGAGWTKQIQPGSPATAELALFTKTAVGSDYLSLGANKSDNAVAWVVYEFAAGTSLINIVGESANDNTFPPITGLSGEHLILSAFQWRAFSADAQSPSATVTGEWTEDLELFSEPGPSGDPDGVFLYVFYRENFLGSSTTPTLTPTVTGTGWSDAREKITAAFAVTVISPKPSPWGQPLSIVGSQPKVTAAQTFTPARPLMTLTGGVPLVRKGITVQPGGSTRGLVGKIPTVTAGGPRLVVPTPHLFSFNRYPPVAEVSLTTATILTLEPPLSNALTRGDWLDGSVTDGRKVIEIEYPNNPLKREDYEVGAQRLDAKLHDSTIVGKKIVFAHGMGAQVACLWLRIYGPTSDIPPAQLEFILTGNLERKYGGIHRVPSPPAGVIFMGGGGQPGIPQNTPYKVIDYARQYDYYADYPNAEKPSQLARLNASTAVFTNYYNVKLVDSRNTSVTEGNITYILSPTILWWQSDGTRDRIEKSYIRPVQAPVVPPVNGPPNNPPAEPDPADLEFPNNITDIAKLAEISESFIPKKKSLHDDWLVQIHGRLWEPIDGIGDDLMELVGTDPRNNLPTASLKIKGDSPLIAKFFDCEKTMIGVTVETAGLRFPYYVDSFDYEFNEGEWVGTANLLGIWDILNYLQIWPMWLFPIQAQPFSHAIYIGAICMCIENMIAEQAMRIQTGMWEFVNNALSGNPDIRAWFGTILQGNGKLSEMLKTPIYVVRTNPFLDTSPLIARTVRMESCGTVIKDVTRAYGVDVRVDLWLPGDDQPDPWADLVVPTYVVTVKDRSQIEGPTKTVVDSAIRTIVDLGGAFFGEIEGVVEQVPGMSGVYTSPLAGTSYTPPWAILIAPEPGEKGSILNCKITAHTPKGWQHIIGGRSPKWLNDLFNATFAWIIDSISILIGFTGIPSNLLEGFMNNAFLAFQLIQVYSRRAAVGPYHPNIEVFHATSSSPYNIETVFAFINAIWDTRGYVSAQATFRNGEVLTLGKDVFRGGLISVLYMGRTRLFTDYIENVMFRLTPSERDVFVQIGDGKAEEAPLAKHQRFITAVIESINVATLAPQSG